MIFYNWLHSIHCDNLSASINNIHNEIYDDNITVIDNLEEIDDFKNNNIFDNVYIDDCFFYEHYEIKQIHNNKNKTDSKYVQAKKDSIVDFCMFKLMFKEKKEKLFSVTKKLTLSNKTVLRYKNKKYLVKNLEDYNFNFDKTNDSNNDKQSIYYKSLYGSDTFFIKRNKGDDLNAKNISYSNKRNFLNKVNEYSKNIFINNNYNVISKTSFDTILKVKQLKLDSLKKTNKNNKNKNISSSNIVVKSIFNNKNIKNIKISDLLDDKKYMRVFCNENDFKKLIFDDDKINFTSNEINIKGKNIKISLFKQKYKAISIKNNELLINNLKSNLNKNVDVYNENALISRALFYESYNIYKLKNNSISKELADEIRGKDLFEFFFITLNNNKENNKNFKQKFLVTKEFILKKNTKIFYKNKEYTLHRQGIRFIPKEKCTFQLNGKTDNNNIKTYFVFKNDVNAFIKFKNIEELEYFNSNLILLDLNAYKFEVNQCKKSEEKEFYFMPDKSKHFDLKKVFLVNDKSFSFKTGSVINDQEKNQINYRDYMLINMDLNEFSKFINDKERDKMAYKTENKFLGVECSIKLKRNDLEEIVELYKNIQSKLDDQLNYKGSILDKNNSNTKLNNSKINDGNSKLNNSNTKLNNSNTKLNNSNTKLNNSNSKLNSENTEESVSANKKSTGKSKKVILFFILLSVSAIIFLVILVILLRKEYNKGFIQQII
ncbi:hypothetical protein EHP00_1596 [Ecytonucleospora hepatopenaei]|uniref:Uncharacterized protein n=1 Tax=Ecytonucleospora hepatopenaei TaxID=646526 RepID=A0A1W0E8V0_9MICR|nr:hypothetical protein EHP00_1596 [Ecytonucleospora hepatopenaei]